MNKEIKNVGILHITHDDGDAVGADLVIRTFVNYSVDIVTKFCHIGGSDAIVKEAYDSIKETGMYEDMIVKLIIISDISVNSSSIEMLDELKASFNVPYCGFDHHNTGNENTESWSRIQDDGERKVAATYLLFDALCEATGVYSTIESEKFINSLSINFFNRIYNKEVNPFNNIGDVFGDLFPYNNIVTDDNINEFIDNRIESIKRLYSASSEEMDKILSVMSKWARSEIEHDIIVATERIRILDIIVYCISSYDTWVWETSPNMLYHERYKISIFHGYSENLIADLCKLISNEAVRDMLDISINHSDLDLENIIPEKCYGMIEGVEIEKKKEIDALEKNIHVYQSIDDEGNPLTIGLLFSTKNVGVVATECFKKYPDIQLIAGIIPAISTITLRSPSGGVDVSKIAAKFGGGGHVCAAGFPAKHDSFNIAPNNIFTLMKLYYQCKSIESYFEEFEEMDK